MLGNDTFLTKAFNMSNAASIVIIEASLWRRSQILSANSTTIDTIDTSDIRRYSLPAEGLDNALSNKHLTLQGEENYNNVVTLVAEQALINALLQQNWNKSTAADIPVDIDFIQGLNVLDLK